MFVISGFRSIRPAYVREQGRTLDWLCAAHTQAEATHAKSQGRCLDEAAFAARMRTALNRFGCGQDKIATRGYELTDCDHTRWDQMEVYPLRQSAQGAGMRVRTRIFERIAADMLERLYDEPASPPSDLLHVTCTGYASPSAAQRLVARRGWGASTPVTHVYHMGCYAAFPALRLAVNAAASPLGATHTRSDIVHTELCSLHMNPLDHSAEQLVVQSLFADGFIAYSVTETPAAELRAPALEPLALLERVIPDSSSAMSWRCSDWGMQMTLARDVPERIVAVLGAFLAELGSRADIAQDVLRRAVFAVHPGGPRILDRVHDVLRLEDAQLGHSRKVLRERGNMSSATLPHIWQEIIKDSEVESGTPIVSLAFGPGLTVAGAVMRKVVP